MVCESRRSWSSICQGASAAFVFGLMFAAGVACLNAPGTTSITLISPAIANGSTTLTSTLGDISLGVPNGARYVAFETSALSFAPSKDVILLSVELTCDSFSISGDSTSLSHWGIKYAGPDTPVPMQLEGEIASYASPLTGYTFGDSGSGVFLSDSRAFDLAWQGITTAGKSLPLLSGATYSHKYMSAANTSNVYLPYSLRFCANVLTSFTIRANSAPTMYFAIQLAAPNGSSATKLRMTNAKLVIRYLEVS